MNNTIEDSKAFVLEQAKLNIERVSKDASYVGQAKQVNASLASIVAMERNHVMLKAVERMREKNLPPALDV